MILRCGDKYAGEYAYNEETGNVSGCPARAATIKTFVKCLKTKSAVKGAAMRAHAEAMTIEEIRQIMQWSEAQCPSEKLESDATISDAEELSLIVKHALMRAFMSTGYTLWTRSVTSHFGS